ncbi:MAG: hypothetical protein FWE32_06720 [Oscillospiraceae bacterium]|nr:hypothetical protein [Oscillospiraceae bacterium]
MRSFKVQWIAFAAVAMILLTAACSTAEEYQPAVFELSDLEEDISHAAEQSELELDEDITVEEAIESFAESAWDAAYNIVRHQEDAPDSTDPISRRDIVYFFVRAVMDEYQEDYNFYLPEFLSAEADMDVDEFVDTIMYALTDEQVAQAHWTWANAWLYYYLEEIVWMLYSNSPAR